MSAILDLPEMRARVQRWTVAQYERLAELGEVPVRAELIRGIVFEKMPKSPLHEYLTARIGELLRRWVRAGFFVRQEASLRLADSVPEPDVSVVPGTPEDFLTCHPTTAALVVEVAVTSALLDRANASLYAEAGVAEYWIVLGHEEQVEAYRQPENGIYQSRRIYARGELIEGMDILVQPVRVETLFGQVGR